MENPVKAPTTPKVNPGVTQDPAKRYSPQKLCPEQKDRVTRRIDKEIP